MSSREVDWSDSAMGSNTTTPGSTPRTDDDNFSPAEDEETRYEHKIPHDDTEGSSSEEEELLPSLVPSNPPLERKVSRERRRSRTAKPIYASSGTDTEDSVSEFDPPPRDHTPEKAWKEDDDLSTSSDDENQYVIKVTKGIEHNTAQDIIVDDKPLTVSEDPANTRPELLSPTSTGARHRVVSSPERSIPSAKVRFLQKTKRKNKKQSTSKRTATPAPAKSTSAQDLLSWAKMQTSPNMKPRQISPDRRSRGSSKSPTSGSSRGESTNASPKRKRRSKAKRSAGVFKRLTDSAQYTGRAKVIADRSRSGRDRSKSPTGHMSYDEFVKYLAAAKQGGKSPRHRSLRGSHEKRLRHARVKARHRARVSQSQTVPKKNQEAEVELSPDLKHATTRVLKPLVSMFVKCMCTRNIHTDGWREELESTQKRLEERMHDTSVSTAMSALKHALQLHVKACSRDLTQPSAQPLTHQTCPSSRTINRKLTDPNSKVRFDKLVGHLFRQNVLGQRFLLKANSKGRHAIDTEALAMHVFQQDIRVFSTDGVTLYKLQVGDRNFIGKAAGHSVAAKFVSAVRSAFFSGSDRLYTYELTQALRTTTTSLWKGQILQTFRHESSEAYRAIVEQARIIQHDAAFPVGLNVNANKELTEVFHERAPKKSVRWDSGPSEEEKLREELQASQNELVFVKSELQRLKFQMDQDRRSTLDTQDGDARSAAVYSFNGLDDSIDDIVDLPAAASDVSSTAPHRPPPTLDGSPDIPHTHITPR